MKTSPVDLGFYRSRLFLLISCGAGLRPAWGREMFEMPAHPAAICPSGAFFAYRHDDNRRSACARRCGCLRSAFSCLGQRRVCRVRPGVRFTSERWSSQAGAAPTVRAADLPGRMRPGPPRVPGLAASGVHARAAGCSPGLALPPAAGTGHQAAGLDDQGGDLPRLVGREHEADRGRPHPRGDG